MSEYQYYEFLAIDRPLTNKQIDQVRAFSTRAQITSTHFVNEYHWGDADIMTSYVARTKKPGPLVRAFAFSDK